MGSFHSTPCDVINSNDVTDAVLMRTGFMVVKAGQGRNNTAAAAFVQMFDAAAAADVTLGTTKPRWVIPVPASGVSSGSDIPDAGLQFPLGLVVACTTTPEGATTASVDVAVGV